MRTGLSLLLATTLATPVFAQAPTAARGADSAFARGEWSTALAGYLDLVKRDSTTPAAWFRIGVSLHGLTRYREAADAFTKARRLGSQPLATELRLARAYARLGDRNNVFAHLDSVVPLAAAGLAPSTVRDEPDFASVQADARFTAVLTRLDAARYPCHVMPEAKQFDFWIGQWDVAPWSAPPGTPAGAAGFNDVHAILEQCVLLENWRGIAGGEGKSFNYFDTNTRKWRQVWVADGGGSLDYSGEFKDGAMRFEGWSLGPQGARVLQKMTFTPFGRDTVRQTMETSSDSGKTWTVIFDGRYLRRR
jgi:hypothetical protein